LAVSLSTYSPHMFRATTAGLTEGVGGLGLRRPRSWSARQRPMLLSDMPAMLRWRGRQRRGRRRRERRHAEPARRRYVHSLRWPPRSSSWGAFGGAGQTAASAGSSSLQRSPRGPMAPLKKGPGDPDCRFPSGRRRTQTPPVPYNPGAQLRSVSSGPLVRRSALYACVQAQLNVGG
jgi:hypothetical protein